MKKFLLIAILLMGTLSYAQEKYNPLAKPNTYRNADNPNYWKNKMPHAGYWQQDVHYRIKANIDETTRNKTKHSKNSHFKRLHSNSD